MESNSKSGILGLFRYFWQNKSRKTAFIEPSLEIRTISNTKNGPCLVLLGICGMVNHMAMKNFRLCVRSLKIRGIYQQQVKDIPQTKFQTGFIIAWPGKSLISMYLPTSLLLALSLKYLQFNAMVYCLKKKFYPSITVLFIYCVGGQLFAIQVFKIIGLAFKCSNRINTQYNRFRHFYFQIMHKNYDKHI